MTPRYLGLSFQFDTNRINARGKLVGMNKLDEWRHKGLIELISSAPVVREAVAGGDSARTAKAYSYIFTLDTTRSEDEIAFERTIEARLFPGGARTDSEQEDVRIVAHARKHKCILVTATEDRRASRAAFLATVRNSRQSRSPS